jgi:hypothetical protein
MAKKGALTLVQADVGIPMSARPMPPADLGMVVDEALPRLFAPAPELRDWLVDTFIAEAGKLHNPDHKHLLNADFQCLWAASGYQKQGREVLGTAEEVTFRMSGWQRSRQEQQFEQWFGYVPPFLLTFAADYCREADDAGACSLFEHELYHLGHKRDAHTGELMFDKEGNPKLAIRGHDVEEFVGVVRRYGVPSGDGMLSQLIRAANSAPEISRLHLQQACGTCMLRAA